MLLKVLPTGPVQDYLWGRPLVPNRAWYQVNCNSDAMTTHMCNACIPKEIRFQVLCPVTVSVR
jgi:hypothetical protein